MKKSIISGLFVFTMVVALLMVMGEAVAKNDKFETVLGYMDSITMTKMGTMWTDGAGKLHIRDFEYNWTMHSTSPGLDGATAVDGFNINYLFENATFEGRMWGKLQIYQSDGSWWEGSWNGYFQGGIQYGSGVAHGHGGTIEGKKMKISFKEQAGVTPTVMDFWGEIH